MRDTFAHMLQELAARDPRITLVTGDLGFGVLTRFAQEHPRQFINAGVAEQNMTGLATGLALTGRVVFTYSIANFATLRCLEQIRNDAAYHDANVNVVAVGGGFSYGVLGMSHHATEDLAILRAIPGVTVVVPADPWEVEYLIPWLIQRPGASYLRIDKSSAGTRKEPRDRFEPGRIRQLRAGNALTLIAAGGIVGEAVAAADRLARRDIDVRVLAVHTLRPFDADAVIDAARETEGIVTVEEHVVSGGLGGLVAETVLEAGVAPRAFRRLGVPDAFLPVVGSQAYLRRRCGLDAAGIERSVEQVLRREPAC